MSLRIEETDFAHSEGVWQTLLSSSKAPVPFATPQWQRLWWQHFGQDKRLKLLQVRNNDSVVAIAPLMQQGRVLSLVGDPNVCDYLDLVVDRAWEGRVYPLLWDYLHEESWETLDIHGLCGSSPTLHTFASFAEERGYRVEIAEEDVCPILNLPSNWEDYLALLSKKDRHELRRKLRRLEAAGSIGVEVLASPEEVDPALPEFFRLHRWSKTEKAHFMTESMERFFRDIAQTLARLGLLRLCFLALNNTRVATVLCFDAQGEVSLYNSGFDPNYGSLSVGLLLKALLVKGAIEAGKRRFNFLRGAEPYKYDLGAKDVPVYRCTITRSS